MILEPFKHDCDSCQWVGWVVMKNRYGNMYLCPPRSGHGDDFGTVVVRFSNEPSDYWSMSAFRHSPPCNLDTSDTETTTTYGELP